MIRGCATTVPVFRIIRSALSRTASIRLMARYPTYRSGKIRSLPFIAPSPAAPCVSRSMMMASTTIARPASRARPTNNLLSDSRTTWPSPPAPMRAAITTIPRAIMIVWLIPVSMVGMAWGSCTLWRVWRGVAPNISAASTVEGSTEWIPSVVKRITGGSA